uniref:DNA-directed RNA polymerase n=1 Tax=Panagrellus redivivus TaxID=6233 RepID=A0A7E4VPA5_PANRE
MDFMLNQILDTVEYYLLLEGNPLVCDDKMEWLEMAALADDTLKVNRVCATVVPTCVAPIKHAGKSLKDVYVDNDKKKKHQVISNKLYG